MSRKPTPSPALVGDLRQTLDRLLAETDKPSLTASARRSLEAEIRKVIEEAIIAGGSTISDFKTASGELGYFQHRFQVYDREGEDCIVCAKPVKRRVQSGRSTFYCAACQRA